jgi:hypothetical protein
MNGFQINLTYLLIFGSWICNDCSKWILCWGMKGNSCLSQSKDQRREKISSQDYEDQCQKILKYNLIYLYVCYCWALIYVKKKMRNVLVSSDRYERSKLNTFLKLFNTASSSRSSKIKWITAISISIYLCLRIRKRKARHSSLLLSLVGLFGLI